MTRATARCGAVAGVLADLEPWNGMLRVLEVEEAGQDELVLPCEQVLASPFLNRCIDEVAERLGATHRRAVVSLWCKYYEASVITGTLAAMVLRGVGMDASVARAGMLMRGGLPRAMCLPEAMELRFCRSRWPMQRELPDELAVTSEAADDAALRDFVWDRVFAGHLVPFVERVAQATGLRPRIIWSNIGGRCAYLFDTFVGEAPQASTADRDALLAARQVAWTEGRNPLHEPVRYCAVSTPAGVVRAPVRKTCCLRDRLPERAMCSTCPRLSDAQRREALASKGDAG